MDADAKTNTCYEKKKPSIYKWRENNKEKYNIICNKAQAIYYVKNKEKISQRKKEWYARRKAEKLATLLRITKNRRRTGTRNPSP